MTEPIELRTEEPQRNRTHVWHLYWFHASDPDASYRADRETLAKAGYVPASQPEPDAHLVEAAELLRLASKDPAELHSDRMSKWYYADGHRDQARSEFKRLAESVPAPAVSVLAGDPSAEVRGLQNSLNPLPAK